MLVYVSALISMIIALLAGIPYLEFLKKNMYGQFIREEGPASHSKKAGTPTTGGVIILIAALLGSILALIMDQKANIDSFIVLLVLCLFGLVGFKDDIGKILKKHNKGLGARTKLLLQILIAAIPAVYMTLNGETSISVFNLYQVNLGFLYPVFAVLVITGSSNAVNLTDGLDGLASGLMVFAMTAIAIISFISGHIDLAIISAAVAGSCLGFLYYNKFPAKVFMGDTGSLALGGILGTLAVIGKFELWLLIIGGVFVIETLSVMIQVTSFKTTGKRIFKMSPIHHHFELSGWSEQKIVYVFWSIGLFLAIITCILNSVKM